jgi:hypothetical protein
MKKNKHIDEIYVLIIAYLTTIAISVAWCVYILQNKRSVVIIV